MAYVDGIDTLEEYKKNKQLLQEERRSIEERINLIPAPAAKMNESAALRSKIKTVYDGLLDDSLSMQSKNELIKSVVEKIVFNNSFSSPPVNYPHYPHCPQSPETLVNTGFERGEYANAKRSSTLDMIPSVHHNTV